MTEIAMPRLSDSMEEGTILKWLVADGGPVRTGEELLEIETDKATVVHSSDADGLLEILAPEGATLPVGAPIARVGAAIAGVGAPAAGMVEGAAGEGDGPDGAAAPPTPVAVATPVSTRAPATPLARRAALLHDVRLELLAGTGPRGRVTRADVLRAGGADGGRGATERIEPSRRQRLVARRMAEAKATIPHFQVQTEVAMDAAIALRAELKASANGRGTPSREGAHPREGAAPDEGAPSLNDLVVKASATALRRHPRANGSYSDGGFELHGRVNVGVAVAGEDALVVAVVKDADTKSLGAIARETRGLAERVRAGTIAPPELSGATFTVSNLGMFGMTAITPVIDPPQAAILGVGALRETLARVDGEIVDRTLLTLTLSCDHRILYGADAARLLAEIRDLLERPLGLAL